MSTVCPCGTGKIYDECCKCYHMGILPENALKLMRSRYSAYALQLPSYIMETTHPLNAHYQRDQKKWALEILSFSQNTFFEKLEILEFIDGKGVAFVTFIAHLRQNGKKVLLKERSRFEKVGERWLYRDADFLR